MIAIKIHSYRRRVVAVCDSNLLGKKFEEGVAQLDVRENFFNGKLVTSEEALKTMKLESRDDSCFNIIGKESIKLAKKANIINDQGIAYIDNIPYALVLL